MAQSITVHAVSGAYLATLTPGYFLAEYNSTMGEVNTGALLTVDSLDPVLVATPTLLKIGRFVHVVDGSKGETFKITNRPERVVLAPGNVEPPVLTFSLASAWSDLNRFSIDPTVGMYDKASEYRPFGPGRFDYDDSAWVPVVTSGTIANPAFERDGEQFPGQWNKPTDVNYIHATSTGLPHGANSVAEGLAQVRTTFEITTATTIYIKCTVDDELFEFWVGEHLPFSDITGRRQWTRTFTGSVDLEPGDYAAAAIINNLDDRGSITGDNPAHFAAFAVDEDGDEVFRTDSSWVAYDEYPITVLPGESFGLIVGVLVSDGQGRTLPATWVPTFDDDEDTLTNAWEIEAPWKFSVRVQSIMNGIQDMMFGMGVDHFEMAPNNADPTLATGFDINAYQDLGSDLSASIELEAGVDIVVMTEGQVTPGINDIWSLTKTSWAFDEDTDAKSAYGAVEGGEIVGSKTTVEEYTEVSPKVLEQVNPKPRQKIEIVEIAGKIFGVDYDLGDTITIPLPDGNGTLTPGPVRVLAHGPIPNESGGPETRRGLLTERIDWID